MDLDKDIKLFKQYDSRAWQQKPIEDEGVSLVDNEYVFYVFTEDEGINTELYFTKAALQSMLTAIEKKEETRAERVADTLV